MSKLNPEYWNDRYAENKIGWDMGEVSPPIKAYFDQVENKELKILIPGAGNAHEVVYLFNAGFKNVHVLDYAEQPMNELKERLPELPDEQIHIEDFFEHRGEYDIIVEQTLFCAIDPSLREKYAQKASDLLKEGGKLIGLLFNREFESGPPFGGDQMEYVVYFAPVFTSVEMYDCYNSHPARQGSELFIRMIK